MTKQLLNLTSPRNLALLSSLTLIYFISGKLGLMLAFVPPFTTPIWLPAGIAFAAFSLLGYRLWPAVLIGSFVGHVATVGLGNASFAIPVGSTIEGLVGAFLVNNFAHGRKAFDTAKGVFLFVLFACICAPSIDATVGVASIYLTGRSNSVSFGLIWLGWWLAHAVGILLISPFLILLLRAPHHRLDPGETAELTVLLLLLIFTCLLVFGPLSLTLNKSGLIRTWLCIPFLIWAGFRFCQLEAAGSTLILFGSAIWGTLHGYGSFVAQDPATSLVLLDSFIAVIGTMTLVVSAMVVERRRIEEELLGTQSLLQEALKSKDRQPIVTVSALEVEVTGHEQTRQALRESPDQRNTRLEEADSDEHFRESPSRRER